jgi:hypothetical protein
MRTEKWCRAKGLVYTGISERLLHDIKPRLDELKSKGYTAYLAQWDKDPLSRSSGGGWSIFAEIRWALDEEEKRITKELNELPARRKLHQMELERELKELDAREMELNSQMAGIRVKQMGGPW